MGDDRRDCCERECMEDCKDRCFQECYCDNNSGGGLNIIWILVIVYLLFCNKDGKGGGGLFGGLF